MSITPRSLPAAALTATLVILLVMPLLSTGQAKQDPASGVTTAASDGAEAVATLRLRIKPLPEGVRRISLQRDAEGARWFLVERHDGTVARLTPDQLAVLLDPGEAANGFLFRLLNITSTAGFLWVGLGLLGQVLFTGRMLLQWLVSEREKRSVVPVGFWWMSLSGASMLLLYFVWRKDIVGVLGQSTGWFIYARNLWLIYGEQKEQSQ